MVGFIERLHMANDFDFDQYYNKQVNALKTALDAELIAGHTVPIAPAPAPVVRSEYPLNSGSPLLDKLYAYEMAMRERVRGQREQGLYPYLA